MGGSPFVAFQRPRPVLKGLRSREAARPLDVLVRIGSTEITSALPVIRTQSTRSTFEAFDCPTLETSVAAEVTGFSQLPGRPSIINSGRYLFSKSRSNRGSAAGLSLPSTNGSNRGTPGILPASATLTAQNARLAAKNAGMVHAPNNISEPNSFKK
jgi:hypothetical protein